MPEIIQNTNYFMKVYSLRHCFLVLVVWLALGTQTLHAAWQIPIVHYTPEQYAAGTQNWQLAEQEDGWIYVANNHGLLEYDGNNWGLYGIWNSTTIRSVLVSKDDAIYVGATNDFGVFRPNVRGGLTYKPLTLNMDDSELHFGEIWSITEIDDVLYFQAKHHIFKVQSDGDIQTITSSANIYTCAKLGGALFVATSEGLAVLSGAKLVVLHGSELLRGSEIRRLVALDDERLLIATDLNGLYILEDNVIRPWKTKADAFMHRNQLATCAANADNIAIGTVMEGVVVLDYEGRVQQYISHRDGLQNNTVLSLMFDRAGNLWAGLDQGLDCILLESDRCFLSQSTDTSSRAQYNKLYVRKMRTISPEEHVVYGESFVASDTTIVLPPADYSLAFDFGGIFAYDEATRFATYLEPMEETYGPWTEENSKEYTLLSAGRYTLHVRALVGEEEYETSLSFRICPPWYQTIWAYIIYALLGLCLLAAVIWRIICVINESKHRLEQEKQNELRKCRMKIQELEDEKAQMDLQAKSQELNDLLFGQINKSELAMDVLSELRCAIDELENQSVTDALKRLHQLQERLAKNTEDDEDRKKLEDSLDLVNASFLKTLGQRYPWMTKNEKKLCVYIKMGLLTKEIAPLMGLTTRGVEMLRYRMRQKMELEPQLNLKEYFDTMANTIR